jgi:hypothetical protein
MAAAAIAPLTCFAVQPAFAQSVDTISNTQDGPISTATSVSGGAGDISIASGGTVNVLGPNPGIILNSNNNVTNDGSIASKDVSGVTGIYVAPGGPWTGALTNSGAITLSESFTPNAPTSNESLAEEPYAQGTNRIAINVASGLNGEITQSGTITIQANGSATAPTVGLLINGPVTVSGPFSVSSGFAIQNSGTITVTGDNAYGIQINAPVTGNVQITGAVTMKGQNSVGLQTTSAINGTLSIYSGIQTTAYADTSRPTGTSILNTIQANPADVEQGGSAVMVQGSVTGGVFLGAPPSGTVSTDTTTDADGDGIVDSAEGTGSITTYGSAPALVIGGTNANITLGNFTGTVSPQNQYGLVVEGTITAAGVYDGLSATALQIGNVVGSSGAITTGTVNLSGGIDVVGTISASSYSANATAVNIGSGAVIPGFRNVGTITANVNATSAYASTAVQIAAGSTVSTLYNAGVIAATVTGNTTNTWAIRDQSGSLSTIINTGVIETVYTTGTPGAPITPQYQVAIDASANTTGVTLTQSPNATSVASSITGDILLSQTGPNTVNFDSGTVNGVLNMGGGAGGSLELSGAAVYTGALLYTGSGLNSITVAGGSTLQDNSPSLVRANTLSVDSTSTLIVALDPQRLKNAGSTATQFIVSGAASFASGAKIGATVVSEPNGASQTFTIVQAGSLSVGSTSTLLSSVPYLFNGSLSVSGNNVDLTLTTKTAAQLQLNKAETGAFSAIYAALPQDTGIQTAVLGAVTRETFLAYYDQLMPESSGEVFETALGFSKAVSRTTADRFDLSTEKLEDEAPSKTGFWASEFYSGVDQTKQQNNPYHSAGLGVIVGYDLGGTGFTVSGASSNVVVPHSSADTLNSVSVVEVGAYAAPRFGPLSIDARVGAGYLKDTDHRQFVATEPVGDTSTATTVTRTAEGDWSGYDFTGHLGVGVQLNVNSRLFFQPKVYADIFHLHEDAYKERNIGPSTDPTGGFLLNVNQRDSTQTSGVASVVTGYRFGTSFVLSPQMELGVDDVFTGGAGSTTARFAYGGPSFTVPANTVGAAALGRLTLRGDGNYVHFAFQAGGEANSSYRAIDLKAVFRLVF